MDGANALQLIVVYLGVIFEQKDTSSKNRIISDSVLAVGFRGSLSNSHWTPAH